MRQEKIARSDKLFLAFSALALALVQGTSPTVGKIVHGCDQKLVRVSLDSPLKEIHSLLPHIKKILEANDAPTLTLNKHCSECVFRSACRTVAEQTDNISLMGGMSEKEIEKHRSRGISTVTQYSCTFHPGRRGKRKTGKARKHDHALQALAFREKKVYVLDSPTIPRTGAALYLDVEGIPDRDFYYLIGLLAVQNEKSTFLSFWADGEDQQKAIWDACANAIKKFDNYTLYHFGSYELRFLDRMRLLATGDEANTVDHIRSRSCNVLGLIYSHIYFPTLTNGLKDIGAFLGAKWSTEGASGIQSVVWRLTWEQSKEQVLKQRLLQYNQEDCLALCRVSEFLSTACGGETPKEGQPVVAQVSDLQSAGFRFGKTEFFCPELAHINKCAYSDYQREKVYLRTSPAIRKSLRRKQRVSKVVLKANQEIECGRPNICPVCGSHQVHSFCRQRYYKSVFDLRFTRSGIKKWIVRYGSLRYRCGVCRKTFYADEYRNAAYFGPSLSSWTVYHHIALRQSYEDLTTSLNDIFGFSFNYSILRHIKPRMAAQHRTTYNRLKEILRQGPLIHGDETKVKLQSTMGYVWAFTNMEEVIYAYTPTREGTILTDLLTGFQGVLVSDFYSAYDSPDCQQQKCLIHLIRDINDDLFHNPFDEELKQLTQKFVSLLKPIIETIDRFGLKRHFLNKHKLDVDRYYRYLFTGEFHSELAKKYQKRIRKYRDKLFVFLDHDGIPWNNNNAENAIKLFASRRKLIGASFTEKGIHDYLVLLSIYQTCRRKNLNFLQFLRSGMQDIDMFAESRSR